MKVLNFLFIFSLSFLIVFSSGCHKDNDVTAVENEYQFKSDYINNNPELKAQLITAMQNDEAFISEVFTYGELATGDQSNDAQATLRNSPIGGAEIESGPIGSGDFELHRPSATLFGSNAVDDIAVGFKDRFNFVLPPDATRCITLYTIDCNGNFVTQTAIVLPSNETLFSFLTRPAVLGIGSIHIGFW